MGKTTIGWTDYTWNPWMGCRKVSAGCKNCYMFRDQERYGNDPTQIRRSKTKFDYPLSLIVHKGTKGTLIFTCSWSDFFIEEADEWRDEAWDIIKRTPHLTYQILTKRPENILSRLPEDWGDGWDNVWLGVSIESQEHILRAFVLNKIPAKMRFVSAEPLLGEIYLKPHLTQWVPVKDYPKYTHVVRGIDWVIVGGESGPNFRPMKLKWAISLAEQCEATHLPRFFMKQDSGPKPGMRGRIPDDLWIQEFPVTNG